MLKNWFWLEFGISIWFWFWWIIKDIYEIMTDFEVYVW